MLGPHHGKDAQLHQVRLASEQLFDVREFFGREIVGGNDLRSNWFHDFCPYTILFLVLFM